MSLVLSLIVMGMLLVMVISLSAFLFLELKITESAGKRMIARQNAMVGVRIALGQLQLLAGNDQRVTATADILGNGENKSLPEGKAAQEKKHWTGVWATGGLNKSKLRDWDYTDPDKKPFLGWLVSHANNDTGDFSPLQLPVSRQSAEQEGPGREMIQKASESITDASQWVTVLGPGSLGTDPAMQQERVQVSRVALTGPAGQKTVRRGNFAYWVSDEGVKMRVNLADAYSDAYSAQTPTAWEKGFASTAPQRWAVEHVTGLGNFENWWKQDATTAGRFPYALLPYLRTAGDMSLYAKTGALANEAKARFHDITFHAKGVLSDTFNGGLKTDLSMAFEMPWEAGDGWPQGYKDLVRFHDSEELNNLNLVGTFGINANAPENKWWADGTPLGYVYEITTGEGEPNAYVRGPTWDVLRNYYRLYKREQESRGYRGQTSPPDGVWMAQPVAPYSYSKGSVTWTRSLDGFTGLFGGKYSYGVLGGRATRKSSYSQSDLARLPNFYARGVITPVRMKLTPQVLRVTFRVSAVYNEDTLGVGFEPIVVIHNPYNVPIEFYGMGFFASKFNPLTFTVRNLDTGAAYTISPSDGNWVSTRAWTYRVYNNNGVMDAMPVGNIRMAPGEVKVFFPADAVGDAISHKRRSPTIGAFRYAENSNFFYRVEQLNPGFFRALNNSPISVSVSGGFQSENDMLDFNLFYPKTDSGAILTGRELCQRNWASESTSGQADYDVSDEHFLTKIVIVRNALQIGVGSPYVKQIAQSPGTGLENAIRQPILAWDCYATPALDAAGGLASPLYANLRASNISYKNYDGNRGVGINWVNTSFPLSSMSPVQYEGENAFWGDALDSSRGKKNVVLFEVPQRPLVSLGSFQSVDCSVTESEHAYVFGNSYRALDINSNKDLLYWPSPGGGEWWGSPRRYQPRFDSSFAANLMTWDSWFFSGANAGNISGQNKSIKAVVDELFDPKKENPLANKKMSFTTSSWGVGNDSARTDFINPEKTARFLFNEGSFNINSTSREAWKALLACLNNQWLSVRGSFEKHASPFSRVAFPAASAFESTNDAWNAFRSLSNDEIDTLAELIVEEVRVRGPFMSLGDFVNRRLVQQEQGEIGALQAAIDKSKLNKKGGLDISDSPSYKNLSPLKKIGAPGFLMQGDILAAVGAGIAPRSDTFVIRAYGEALGLTGQSEAQAWCEVVVQRQTGWMEPEDLDAAVPLSGYRNAPENKDAKVLEKMKRNDQLKRINQVMGRRFTIVSVRWLSPSEI